LTLGVLVPAFAAITTRDRNRRLQLLFYTIGVAPAWATCWSHFLISMGLPIYPRAESCSCCTPRSLPLRCCTTACFQSSCGSAEISPTPSALCSGIVYLGVLALVWNVGPQTAATFYVHIGVAVLLVSSTRRYLPWMQKKLDSLFFRSSVDREQLLDALCAKRHLRSTFFRLPDRSVRPSTAHSSRAASRFTCGRPVSRLHAVLHA